MRPQFRNKVGCLILVIMSLTAIAGMCFAADEPLIKNKIVPTPYSDQVQPTPPAKDETRYLVVVGFDGCSACKGMQDDIKKLRESGVAVYYVDYNSQVATELRLKRRAYPVIAVVGKTVKGAAVLTARIGAMPFRAMAAHAALWKVSKIVGNELRPLLK